MAISATLLFLDSQFDFAKPINVPRRKEDFDINEAKKRKTGFLYAGAHTLDLIAICSLAIIGVLGIQFSMLHLSIALAYTMVGMSVASLVITMPVIFAIQKVVQQRFDAVSPISVHEREQARRSIALAMVAKDVMVKSPLFKAGVTWAISDQDELIDDIMKRVVNSNRFRKYIALLNDDQMREMFSSLFEPEWQVREPILKNEQVRDAIVKIILKNGSVRNAIMWAIREDREITKVFSENFKEDEAIVKYMAERLATSNAIQNTLSWAILRDENLIDRIEMQTHDFLIRNAQEGQQEEGSSSDSLEELD